MEIDKKNGVPQSSILGPLFFLLYRNDLRKINTKKNSMVLFADDASLLITDSNGLDFNIDQFCKIISWFNNNLLILNLNKAYYVEFETKNYYEVKTKVKYEQKIFQISLRLNFWE